MTLDMKSYYEQEYKEKQIEADLGRKNRLRFCFPSNLKNKRIINIGSGPGVDIEFLANENEVHAVDISEVALRYAKTKRMIVHNIDLNKSSLPFDDNYFDVVIATDILEHLFDPKKLLFEIRRLLKVDGFAILSVPNHFYWKRRLSILFGKGGVVLPFHNSNEYDYFHIRFFTVKGWEGLLKSVNFTIVERFYDQFNNVPRGLPSSIDKILAKRFPGLFSMHFISKVKK
ncbi:MAG: class I SAM-dependent methyltransferase [Candidatus Scalindua sp.]|nr:class I SAM-dependent methyltransferase [Candidatus Scalindua sp.]